MKHIIKYIIALLIILSSNIIPINNTFSTTLVLPNTAREEDINIDNTQLSNNISNEWTIMEYIQIINFYLWFAIAWIAMAILIYSWMLMITAWWDKSKVWKAWKMALYCLIGIVVAMLSYVLVNLIINLL